MATIRQLLSTTHKFKPALFINADRVYVDQLKITRNVGTRSIIFSAITRDSEHNHARTAQIMFVVPKSVEDIDTYRPSLSKDKALVRSSSPWYRFAFQYNNQKIGAQFGRIKPFTVKGTGHPVNPENYPGLDKHLIALVRALLDNKLVRD